MRRDIETLELQNVSFAFEQEQVFREVSFALPKSRAVWIRSPAGGRGKSTLLKILAGLLTPQQGRVLINGQDVLEMSFEQFLSYRLNLGYGFDMGGLLNNRTLTENLILPLEYHKLLTPSEASARVAGVTERFGLHAQRNLRPFAVSGSQRKLTCVLRAFIHWPQVVLLDDPATGLKHESLDEMYEFVAESFAQRGLRQMFFTSENPEWARRFNAEEMYIATEKFCMKQVAA